MDIPLLLAALAVAVTLEARADDARLIPEANAGVPATAHFRDGSALHGDVLSLGTALVMRGSFGRITVSAGDVADLDFATPTPTPAARVVNAWATPAPWTPPQSSRTHFDD